MLCTSILDYLPTVQWNYAVGISMAVVGVVATVENALLMMVLLSYNAFRKSSFRILTSLVYTNLLSAVILAPMYAVRLLYYDVIKSCMFDGTLRYLSATLVGASCFTLGFMSYDRYRCLRSPNIGGMTKKMTYSGLTTCWLMALLLPSPSVYKLKYTPDVINMFWVALMSAVIVISCAGLLSALYCSRECCEESDGILTATLRDGKPNSVFIFMKNPHFQDSLKSRIHRYEARTVIIILSTYIIMFLPLFAHSVLTYTRTLNQPTLSVFYVIATYIAVSNSVVNPLIYVFRMSVLRNHVVKVLRSLSGRKKRKVGDHPAHQCKILGRNWKQ